MSIIVTQSLSWEIESNAFLKSTKHIYAKPKFSKSGVLDRFAEGSALIRLPALREAQERRAYVLLMFYFFKLYFE